jgi:serine/threonine protein kinase
VQRSDRYGVSQSDPAYELSPRGTTLFQERLRIYALTELGIAVGYWPSFYAVWSNEPGVSKATVVAHILSRWTFALLVVHASLWVACRGRPLSPAWLPRIDVVYHMALGLVFGRIVADHPSAGVSVLEGLLALTCVLSVRALIVPSSGRRTALVGVVMALGSGLSLWLDADHFATAWLAPRTSGALFVTWSLIAVILSSVASMVLYGLRREVRDARRFGQYTLVEQLGQGGMGVVYRAEHSLLRRPTAVKLLQAHKSADSLERFEREVQLMAQLTHPNTVAIYDYGRTADGVFYYAMEYLDGVDLEGLVAVGGLQPAARVIHLVRQICSSLEEAHGSGIVHRDIKPANIFLCRNRSQFDTVKVLDFGLVKRLESGDPALSAPDAVLGTPLYMAPEALMRPKDVGVASDLYSLGALTYFLLTGTPPFTGNNMLDIGIKQMQQAPEPPSRRPGASVPADLEAIVLACLAKSPADRPQSARALRTALEACRDAESWTEHQVSEWWQRFADAVEARQLSRAGSSSLGPESVLVDLDRGAMPARVAS